MSLFYSENAKCRRSFHLGHAEAFEAPTEVYQANKRPYRIIRLFLGQKVHHRQGNDGIDAKKQVDADISDESHSCLMEEPSQQVHPRKCGIPVH